MPGEHGRWVGSADGGGVSGVSQGLSCRHSLWKVARWERLFRERKKNNCGGWDGQRRREAGWVHTAGFFGNQTGNYVSGPSSEQRGFSIVVTLFLGCGPSGVDFFQLSFAGLGKNSFSITTASCSSRGCQAPSPQRSHAGHRSQREGPQCRAAFPSRAWAGA